MKKEEIHLWDIKRILLGQTPPEFLLEVFIRTLIIYLATLLILRWLGKRMSGQLSITEIAVMITMGAIVSVPMQMPDRGILQGLVALLVAAIFLRGLHWLSFKNNKIEKLSQGDLILLVKDGVLQEEQMKKSRISRQQLFAELRSKKIYQLGKVKRMYLEACGLFSVYEEKAVKSGLSVLPPSDTEIFSWQKASPDNIQACCHGGNVQTLRNEEEECRHCGHVEWSKAILN